MDMADFSAALDAVWLRERKGLYAFASPSFLAGADAIAAGKDRRRVKREIRKAWEAEKIERRANPVGIDRAIDVFWRSDPL